MHLLSPIYLPISHMRGNLNIFLLYNYTNNSNIIYNDFCPDNYRLTTVCAVVQYSWY